MKVFEPKPWVVPQPVLIIGTYNEDGTPNAMNAAWGGQWNANEIFISLGTHATTDNLKRSGEFTVAFATEETTVASDYVGLVSGRNEPQKMEKTGWAAVKAEKVNDNFLAEDGKPDIEKMHIISFDPVHHGYIRLGEKVGQAFADGNKLK